MPPVPPHLLLPRNSIRCLMVGFVPVFARRTIGPRSCTGNCSQSESQWRERVHTGTSSLSILRVYCQLSGSPKCAELNPQPDSKSCTDLMIVIILLNEAVLFVVFSDVWRPSSVLAMSAFQIPTVGSANLTNCSRRGFGDANAT